MNKSILIDSYKMIKWVARFETDALTDNLWENCYGIKPYINVRTFLHRNMFLYSSITECFQLTVKSDTFYLEWTDVNVSFLQNVILLKCLMKESIKFLHLCEYNVHSHSSVPLSYYYKVKYEDQNWFWIQKLDSNSYRGPPVDRIEVSM